jgi:hypothetical protein
MSMFFPIILILFSNVDITYIFDVNFIYDSGSKYIGEFDLGRRSGTGTLTYPSGLTYTGSFYDGKI